jgi:hypothetical protein
MSRYNKFCKDTIALGLHTGRERFDLDLLHLK